MAGVLLVFVFGFGFCYDLGHSSFGVSSPVYYASFKALGSTVMTFPFIATLAFLLKKQQLKKIGKSEINILQTSLKISTLIYVIFFFWISSSFSWLCFNSYYNSGCNRIFHNVIIIVCWGVLNRTSFSYTQKLGGGRDFQLNKQDFQIKG